MAAFSWDRKTVLLDDSRRNIRVPLDATGIHGLVEVLESRLGRFFDDGIVEVVEHEDGHEVYFRKIYREWSLDQVQDYSDKILAGVVGDAGNGWTAGDEMALSFKRSGLGSAEGA
ncbi:hypothetical protein [Patulibacter minatonensis]|uniref:hypothetical protein n=1 Tax=Patulibacter minatonensis TaxID=298163 RepID=UPI00047CACE4|nr:hypothetical protein [Patulibacter minatonensis]